MSRHDVLETLDAHDTFAELTIDELKPLARLLSRSVPTRKGDLVELLTEAMLNPKNVRELYDSLDEIGKAAVQEATHDDEGLLDEVRFRAKYGRSPDFGTWDYRHPKPSTLRLFFPRFIKGGLPDDLKELLLRFVPEPAPLTVQAGDDLPRRVKRPHLKLRSPYAKPDEEVVDLQSRATSRGALLDIKAILRLVDAGEVRVSDKTRRPTRATLKKISEILSDGDFYSPAGSSEDEEEAEDDLTIKPFAWPLIVQAAGLAHVSGRRLELTPAGRKATTGPAHEVIRHAWDKWLGITWHDEFNRVQVIKGQSKGLTAVGPRRQAIVEVLEECPAGKWIAIDELFRLIKAVSGFEVTRNPWKLYICELQYGSLGYDADYSWEILQGRFVLAFLFEMAATMGLIDVAYICPDSARNDYRGLWGTDDLDFLSRYDGLMFVRLNPLGAWCLGVAEQYQPEAVALRKAFRVLPNLDVVVSDSIDPGDELLLKRFAERQNEAVWHLDKSLILAAVEEGLSVAELEDFLAVRSQEALPQTVTVFLADLQQRTTQLEDLGPARLIACRDGHVAQLLAHDRRLRQLCQLAGEKSLVFRAGDEPAVRKGLRELGYVLPRKQ
jgi:hypothetical protein